MANVPIEIKFAQSLAGNEKKTRDKAIKKLREYFAAKSSSKKDGFTEVDLLKIWKGLHYCMWMQDKPLIQEELSANLCGLLRHLQKVDVQLMFVRTYFITETREWNSIDKWRIDKFMMLYRDMLNASLDMVRRQDWEAGILQGLVAVYGDTVMDPENDRIPDGFKIHLADIFWDEVTKVGGKELDGEQLLVLLAPFIKYLQKTPNSIVGKRVVKSVFEPIIEQAIEKITMQENEEEDEDEEEEKELLNFDIKLLADHLFTLGQDDSQILLRNRPMLFDLVKRLRDVDSGIVPVQEEVEITPGITDHDFSKSVTDLARMLVGDRRSGGEEAKKKKKKSKKKKGNKSVEEKENHSKQHDNIPSGTIPNSLPEESPGEKTVRGKRKLQTLTDDSDVPLTKLKKKSPQDNLPKAELPSADVLSKKKEKKDKSTLKQKKEKHKKEKKNIVPASVDDVEVSLDMEQVAVPGCSSWSVTQKSSEENGDKEANVTTMKKKDKKSKKYEKLEKEEAVTVKNASKKDKKSKTREKLETVALEEVAKAVTKKGKKSKKIGKDTLQLHLDAATESPKQCIPKITVQDTSISDNSKAPKPTDELDDGDVEIWVPNKKYKGNKSSSPKSSFASFDGSKQPVAFVKKALQIMGKKTPKSARLEAPGTPDGSAKSVIFNMKKNKSQSFKDSLNSPLAPFNPERRPDQGILKTPNSRSNTPTRGSVATPVTRLMSTPANSPLARDTRAHLTPGPKGHLTNIVSGNATGKGVKQGAMKKATPMKQRAKAADFFML